MKHKRPWISLLAYCLMTALGAALVLAIIVAGGSVALAGHQSATAEEAQKDTAAIPQNSVALEDGAPGSAQQSDQQGQSPAAPQHSDSATFTGEVTDSHCGARHQRRSNLSSEDCARACIRRGATYILVNGDQRYILSGSEELLNKLLGTRATIVGTLDGDTISVSSVSRQF